MGKGKKAADAKAFFLKRLYGVKPATFRKMLSILQKEYDVLHQKGGKPPALTVEDTLAEDGAFGLPGKKKLKRKSESIQYVVVDVTESPVNRPKNQKEYYSGKKTAHAKDAGHH